MAKHPPILNFSATPTENGDMSRSKIVKEGGYQPTKGPGPFPPSMIREEAGEVPLGTLPLDPEDQKLVMALAHELRVEILGVLIEREATPNELARLLDEGLSQVSYHIKVLTDYEVIELTKTEPRDGAVEHFYRAKQVKWLPSVLEMLASEEPRSPENPTIH